MKKNLLMVAAFVMGMAMSVTLTSCGDDDEPTPTQQNGGNNGNDNGNGGNDQGGNGGGENGGGNGGNDQGGNSAGQHVGLPAGVVAVDLDLPSGTLWANMNVGATKAEEYGLYFAWGETLGYTSDAEDGRKFDYNSYKYSNGTNEYQWTKYCTKANYGYNGFMDDLRDLLPEDDAATDNWGSNWCMPTYMQMEELRGHTNTMWTTQNGVAGYLISSKTNANSIFLPAAGMRSTSSFYGGGTVGNYWSRSLYDLYPNKARAVEFSSSAIHPNQLGRVAGCPVRPVRK